MASCGARRADPLPAGPSPRSAGMSPTPVAPCVATGSGAGGAGSRPWGAVSGGPAARSGAPEEGAWRRSSRRCTSRRPICTANWPTTRAVATCPSTRWRPLAASLGSSSAAVTARPTGTNTSASSSRSLADFRSLTAPPRGGPFPARSRRCAPRPVAASSHAVAAELPLGVGQLTGMLHQEARTAHELVGLLGQDADGDLGPVVGLGSLVLLLVIILLDDQALLEDLIQGGLDVLVVDLFVLLVCLLDHGHRAPGLGRVVEIDEIFVLLVVLEVGRVEVLVQLVGLRHVVQLAGHRLPFARVPRPARIVVGAPSSRERRA